MKDMQICLDPKNIDHYRMFLAAKSLPSYRITGRQASFPDEYAGQLLGSMPEARLSPYNPISGLFDYQVDIARMAIQKRKFAVFADCGLGKTLIMTEFARHAQAHLGASRRVLIVSPLMVIPQTIEAVRQFYVGRNGLTVTQVKAAELQGWLNRTGDEIGITNYDALHDTLAPGRIGALLLDESSMLKSHYGKWGQTCLRFGAGHRH